MIKNRKDQKIRLPRIGTIKVGEKDDKDLPTSLDYFIITGDYADAVRKKYGDKPSELEVFFPSNDIEVNLDEMYRCYGASGLKCIGNGETFTQFTDKYKEPDKCPCWRNDPPEGTKKECFESMRLSFVIKGIGVTGLWQFASKSENSMNNLRASMNLVLNATGTLVGIPFLLKVKMEESNISGVNHKFPVISADCKMQLDEMIEKKLLAPQAGAEQHQLIEEKIEGGDGKEAEIADVDVIEERSNPNYKDFSEEVQAEWDDFDKYLNDNKDNLDKDSYIVTRHWLDTLSANRTVEDLKRNRGKVELQMQKKSSGKYKDYHEDLITECCKLIDAKDRVDVIAKLNTLIGKWDIEKLDDLSKTTENQCLTLLENFEKAHAKDNDLPF